MRQILLVGGYKDGHRVESEHDILQFYKPEAVEVTSSFMSKAELDRVAEVEVYRVEPIQTANRVWWVGIEEHLTTEDAFAKIIGSYP